MELDDRPIAPTSFPWTRVGLALGTLFAVVFAVIDDDDAPPTPTPPPTVVDVSRARDELVVDKPTAVRSAFAPVDAPWPPGVRATGTSSGGGGRVADGASSLSPSEAERFFEDALAQCSPTRLAMGKAVAFVCESARDESRAMMVPHAERGTWLRTSRTSFRVPPPPLVPDRPRLSASDDASCGWTMRFVALPPEARVVGSGGSNDSGHCVFDVPGLPALAWSRMLGNVFRAGTSVQKRRLDDGELTRWTAEGWDGGWWRIDVLSSSVHAQAPADEQHARVELSRWAPGEEAWAPPHSFERKRAALESCWEPCSLALRSPAQELGPDVRAQIKAGDVLDRCLFECRGTQQAPAVLEPAARAFR